MQPTIHDAELFADLEELNRLGDGGGPGVSRVAFTQADMAGRRLVEERLRELGLDVRRDAAGNGIGTLPGLVPGLRPIAAGSHSDTVPEGGRYDGALGVVAAVACARALVSSGRRLRHPLEVIDFVAEEATMGAGTLGSRAMAGLLDAATLEAPAWDGRPVAEHVSAAAIDPGGMAAAARPTGGLAAYVELHVEQGGVLEAAGLPLGVVEGIVGIRRYEVVFEGAANHAGTTPMAGRRDALVMAAPFVLGVRDVATARGLVGTVGTLQVRPGAANVIPGRVALSFELRSLEEPRLAEAEAELDDLAGRCGGRMRRRSAKSPMRSSPRVIAALEAGCRRTGQPHRLMSSGAGHDAMCMAAITESGMLFVPSRGGVSHSPGEHTSPEHCALGARALLAGLLELDERPALSCPSQPSARPPALPASARRAAHHRVRAGRSDSQPWRITGATLPPAAPILQLIPAGMSQHVVGSHRSPHQCQYDRLVPSSRARHHAS